MPRYYQDLPVWQESMKLATEVYKLARLFPEEGREALTTDIMKAAIAVPSRIGEGYGAHHTGEYYRHLSAAHGALMRIETYLCLAPDLGYIAEDQTEPANALIDVVSELILSMMRSLEFEYNHTVGYDYITRFTVPYEIEE